MKRLTPLLSLALLLAFFSSGCLEISSVIQVKKDGSGSITMRSIARPDTKDRLILGALARLSDNPGTTPESLSGIYNAAQLNKMAAKMGNGVKLTGTQKFVDKEGHKGMVAFFSFTNIGNLRLGPSIATAHLADMGLSPIDWSYRFTHQPGNPTTLTILPPANAVDPNALSMREMMGGLDLMPGFENMMAGLVDDVKIKIAVQTEGTIVKSNASYPSQKRPNIITLVDLDMRKLIQSVGIGPLLDLSNLNDVAALQKKNIPGVKIEKPLEQVTIQYQ